MKDRNILHMQSRILLAVLLVFSLILIPVFAASTVEVVLSPTSINTNQGSEFDISLSVNSNDFYVASGEIILEFDETILQVTNYEVGGYYTTNDNNYFDMHEVDNENGLIKAVLAQKGTGKHTADNSWATVTFTVDPAATIGSSTTISTTSTGFVNEDGEEPDSMPLPSDVSVSIAELQKPAIYSIDYAPKPARKEQIIILTADVSDPDCEDNTCVSDTWTQIEGETVTLTEIAKDKTDSPTHVQAYFTTGEDGNYTFKLDLGEGILDTIKLVVENIPPTATVTGPNSVGAGDINGILLTANIVNSDGDEITSIMNFGERKPWGTIQWVQVGIESIAKCKSTTDECSGANIQRLYGDEFAIPIVGEHCICLNKLSESETYPDIYFNIYQANNGQTRDSIEYSITKVYDLISDCRDQICTSTECNLDENDNICEVKLYASDGQDHVIVTKDVELFGEVNLPRAKIAVIGYDSFVHPNNYYFNIAFEAVKNIAFSAAQSEFYDEVLGLYKRDTIGRLEYMWDTGKTDNPWGMVTITGDDVSCNRDATLTCGAQLSDNSFKDVMITNSVDSNNPQENDICYCKEHADSFYVGRLDSGQEITQPYSQASCGASKECMVELTATDKTNSKVDTTTVNLIIEEPEDIPPYFLDVSPVQMDVTAGQQVKIIAQYKDDDSSLTDISCELVDKNPNLVDFSYELTGLGNVTITFTAPAEDGMYSFILRLKDDSEGKNGDPLTFNIHVGATLEIPVVSILDPEDEMSININEQVVLKANNLDPTISIDRYIWHTGKNSNPWGYTEFVGTDIMCVKSDGTAECLRDSPQCQYDDSPILYLDEPCSCEIKYVDKMWNIYPDAVLDKSVPSAVISYDNINDCEDRACTITLRAESKDGKLSNPVNVVIYLQTMAGDLNGDGLSDEDDSELLLDYILGASDGSDIVDLDKANVDGIGEITINDYILHWDEYGK